MGAAAVGLVTVGVADCALMAATASAITTTLALLSPRFKFIMSLPGVRHCPRDLHVNLPTEQARHALLR
jgi:hypothetical protein